MSYKAKVLEAQAGGTGISNTSSITLGGAINTANSLTTAGNFALTLTQTGATNVTLPTSGTLATTSSIPSLPLSGANGGTGVANTSKTITLGGNLTTSGAFDSTFTMTNTTTVTFPTSGTLATTAQVGIPTIGTSTDRALVTWSSTGGAAVLNNSVNTLTSAGQYLSPVGSAGVPTYSFNGFTTLGLYKTSGGGVGLAVGGVGYMTLDSSGNGRFEGNLVVANNVTVGAAFVLPQQAGAGNIADVGSGTIYGFTDLSAPRTMTLASSATQGRIIKIKDQSGNCGLVNTITVSVSGGVKTIDGSTSVVLNSAYAWLEVYGNGTNYFIVGRG